MTLGHELGHASGISAGDYHALGLRFEGESFHPDTGESWVLCFAETRVFNPFWKRGWLTGLWRSPAGTVYVTDAFSRVYVFGAAVRENPRLTTVNLDGTLTGVWGVNEETVFVWGQERGRPIMYVGHDDVWKRIESPGTVLAVHGTRPDLVFAVGETGLIARWDGGSWQRMQSPSDRTLSSVFVVADDEVYACGTGKELLQGSIHGWVAVLEHTTPLRAVAKWKDEVWVAAGGDDGLCQLKGQKLASLKPKIVATRLDARGDLLISCPGKIVVTADGKDFLGSYVTGFEKVAASERPAWRT